MSDDTMDELVEFLRTRANERRLAAMRELRTAEAQLKIIEVCVDVKTGAFKPTRRFPADDVLLGLSDDYTDHPAYREDWRP